MLTGAKNSKNVIWVMHNDKIKGLIFGQAIGDALGLATEFMTKEEVLHIYPQGVSSYQDIIQDRHRSLWQKGAWTDDTDMMLCILESIINNKGVNLTDIAHRFVNWKNNNGIGIGRHTLKVLSIGDYIQNPFKASELIWNLSRQQNAANGAIMRTAIVGCWNFTDLEAIKKNTEDVCRLTHYDPRCVGSCIIITHIVSKHLQGAEITKSELLALANKYDYRIAEYIKLAYQGDVSALQLDEQGKIGYTLKTMSAALWAYLHATDFYSGLKAIIEQGGDADTNGAVVGALLGVKFGFKTIPDHLINNLIGKEGLEELYNLLISL